MATEGEYKTWETSKNYTTVICLLLNDLSWDTCSPSGGSLEDLLYLLHLGGNSKLLKDLEPDCREPSK